MQQSTKQGVGLLVALVAVMAATRYNHFGSAVALPDASLAVFFMAGFLFSRMGWPSLAVFAGLMLEAAGIDWYVTSVQGVSDWCITPAYWFLIPTYGIMWTGGSWLSRRIRSSISGFLQLLGVACLATTLAFALSNGSFYWFSGRVSGTSLQEYVAGAAQYYLPYLTSCMLYLVPVAVAYLAIPALRGAHRESTLFH